MIAAERESNGLAEYGNPKAMNASPLVRRCITGRAAFKEEDGKCGFTSLYHHLIAKDKEILMCSYRGETGTCLLNKEEMTQDQVDELVKMVMDAQKK